MKTRATLMFLLTVWSQLSQLNFLHSKLLRYILQHPQVGSLSSLRMSAQFGSSLIRGLADSGVKVDGLEAGLGSWVEENVGGLISELTYEEILDLCLHMISLFGNSYSPNEELLKSVEALPPSNAISDEKMSIDEKYQLLRNIASKEPLCNGSTGGVLLEASGTVTSREPHSYISAVLSRLDISSTQCSLSTPTGLYVDHVIEDPPDGKSRICVLYWPGKYFWRNTRLGDFGETLKAVPRLYASTLQSDGSRVLIINDWRWNRTREQERLGLLQRLIDDIDSLHNLVLL